MKNNTKIKFVSALFILLLLFLTLSGCQTTDKKDAYLDTSKIESARLEYIQSSNRTKVTWTTTITNDTIYDIDSIDIVFDLYEGESTQTQTYTFKGTAQGEKVNSDFYFYANGKIDYIEFVSWTANYDSFWATYKIAVIVTLGVALVAAIVYIILMIINSWDLDDLGEILSWIIVSIAMLCIGGAITLSSWVIGLIIVGGSLSALLIAFLAQLIFDRLS